MKNNPSILNTTQNSFCKYSIEAKGLFLTRIFLLLAADIHSFALAKASLNCNQAAKRVTTLSTH